LTVRKGVQSDKNQTALSIATDIFQQEGIAGLYAGVGAALALVINPIIQYTVFEHIKTKIAKVRALSSFDFFLLGAFSKLVATGVSYPYL
jgi:adenine nucleotide transporter 17